MFIHRFSISLSNNHTINFVFLLILTFILTLSSHSLAQSSSSISLTLEARQPVPLLPNSTRGFPQHLRFVHPQRYQSYVLNSNKTAFVRRNRVRWISRYHNVQLYGGMVAVGEYYARVQIGGQTVRVQIDTGSATLAVPLSECVNCKEGDMRYNISASNSGQARHISCDDDECGKNTCSPLACTHCSKNNACCAASDKSKCSFRLSFGDGSGAKGYLVRDILKWGDVEFPVTFGGIHSDSEDFERSEVDGILGMSYPSLACNPSCILPTFESMMQMKDIKMKNMFSICITYSSGKIILGDYDPVLSSQKISWVPLKLATPPSFYSFPLIGNMKIDGTDLPLPSYSKAILDSGTTLIVFSHRTFDAFTGYLKQHYCEVPGLCDPVSWFRPAHCTRIAEKDRLKLPTMEFALEGFTIKLSPSEYLINYASKGPDFWCVGLMALSSMSGGVDVIFGNTVMKKYVTVYDRENERVGFAESDKNCGLKKTIGDTPLLQVPGQSQSEPVADEQPEDSESSNEGAKEQPATASGNDPRSNLGAKHSLCDVARNCSACYAVIDVKCRWKNGECIEGDGSFLMCTYDALSGNLLYIIGGTIAAVVAGVVAIFVVVHIYRKRQNGSTSSAEDANEVREPLATSEVNGENAFVIDDDDTNKA